MSENRIHTDIWSALYSEGDNRERLARLSALLRQVMEEELTDRQREAFLLHVGRGYSQKEIAALWGIHPSVVCRHIRRAEAQLKRWTGKLASL